MSYDLLTEQMNSFLKKAQSQGIELCFQQDDFHTMENTERLTYMIAQELEHIPIEHKNNLIKWLQVIFKGSSSFNIEEIFFMNIQTECVSINYKEGEKKYFKQLRAKELFI